MAANGPCRFVEEPGGVAAFDAIGDTVALVSGGGLDTGRPVPAP
jgi:hypothetical protein